MTEVIQSCVESSGSALRTREAGVAEMVERVARRICEAMGQNPDRPLPKVVRGVEEPVDADTPLEWRRWEPIARAAIEAMREPTPTMSTAGKHAVKGCESTFERDVAESAYRVMIDAALSSSGARE